MLIHKGCFTCVKVAEKMNEGKKGSVFLVGAGPGRADLITVRAAELIKLADCIIYDRLVNPDLLDLARDEAEIISTPKRSGGDSVTQRQINELMLEKARAGKVVVRLKGGDPGVFGRGSEEARLLGDAGIEFEIVPGVTAAIAAAEYAGVFLTDRSYSSQVVLVTGHEAEGKTDSGIDFDLLARLRGSIVFYMGMANLSFITDRLIANGMSPETCATVIQNATLPSQRKLTATLGCLAAECEKQNIEPPAIIVIGSASATEYSLDWFSKLPLFGRTIVTTRDKGGNAALAAKLIAQGARAIRFNGIKIKPLTERNEFLRTLTRLTEYNWLVFTSKKAVELVFDCLRTLGKDARVFGCVKIACIGEKTKAVLARFGIIADFVPSVYTSSQLGKQLIAAAGLKDKNILLLRSAQATNELKEILTAAGAKIDQRSVYSVERQKCDCSFVNEMLGAGRIDWLTFASPSAAESFFEQFDPQLVKSARAKIASIGPVTSSRLRQLGQNIDAEAGEHTIDGLIEAIKTCLQTF